MDEERLRLVSQQQLAIAETMRVEAERMCVRAAEMFVRISAARAIIARQRAGR